MKTCMIRYSLVLLLIVCLSFSATGDQPQKIERLTILHTNDFHARLLPEEGRGGAAVISAILKKIQAESENVLILDAGDLITGAPVSTLFLGSPIFEVYNTMPYDAVVLGNHEFDHGWSQISEFLRIAEFPLLAANVRMPDGELITGKAVHKTTRGNLRIGIIGILMQNLQDFTQRIAWEGLILEDPAEVVRRHLEELRPEVDLIIVLSHHGYDADVALAQAIPGIDIIVGGHSHTRLEQPKQVGDTLVVQAGQYGEWVGRLELAIDLEQKRIIESRGELIPTEKATWGKDPDTAAIVDKWEARVREIVDVPIGENAEELNREQLRLIIGEIYRNTFETDFGHQNSGGVRTTLPAGTIIKRQIWNMLPFGNEMVIVHLDRDQLLDYGLTPDAQDFRNLFSVTTNSYVAEKMIADYQLPPERVNYTGKLDRDIVIDFISKHHAMVMPKTVLVEE